jgi:hypothetical protein
MLASSRGLFTDSQRLRDGPSAWQRIEGAPFLTRTMRQKWETTNFSLSRLSFFSRSGGGPDLLTLSYQTNRGYQILTAASFGGKGGRPQQCAPKIYLAQLSLTCEPSKADRLAPASGESALHCGL